VIYAKINEGTNVALNDDLTLYGINANYALDKQTTLEGYFFTKVTDASDTLHVDALTSRTAAQNAAMDTVNTKPDKVHTIGARVVNTSLKNLSYNPALDINAAATRMLKRQAFALEAIATYDLKDIAKIGKYSPSVTGMYIYLSGDNANDKGPEDIKWRGWDPMYENQTVGHLANLIFPLTNAQILSVNGKIKPKEDITLSLDYAYFWLNEAYETDDTIFFNGMNLAGYTMSHNRHLGQELDAKITYDYTEDVQLGLLAGMFLPGSAFQKGTDEDGTSNNRNIANEVIGSMKVTF
ncbi:MAG: alginate export family protein, partial [Candidatus Omnitrophica bacterium]|nr:alginate export family protein [Candidatus Omnitrophota bacterium]